MSSLRLSYASSPESDLEHSPGPPVSPGLSGSGNGNAGRLTKASSDPSVVMPDNSTTDVLPPYQVILQFLLFLMFLQSFFYSQHMTQDMALEIKHHQINKYLVHQTHLIWQKIQIKIFQVI